MQPAAAVAVHPFRPNREKVQFNKAEGTDIFGPPFFFGTSTLLQLYLVIHGQLRNASGRVQEGRSGPI